MQLGRVMPLNFSTGTEKGPTWRMTRQTELSTSDTAKHLDLSPFDSNTIVIGAKGSLLQKRTSHEL